MLRLYLWLESMLITRKGSDKVRRTKCRHADCGFLLCWTAATPSLFTFRAILATYPLGQRRTHTFTDTHTHTHTGDLAHFDVTDSIHKKNGAVKSNNFKDGVDKIGALTPISLLLLVFLFSLLISSSLFSYLCSIKGLLWKKTMNEER